MATIISVMMLIIAIRKKGIFDKPSSLRIAKLFPIILGSDRIADIDTPIIAPSVQSAVKI